MAAADVEEFFDGKRADTGEGVASESPQAPEQEASKPVAVEKAAKPAEPQGEADEEKEEPLPNDVVALQKTVLAIRGDRRRDRKKWREVEERFSKGIEEERRQREEVSRERARLEGELTALRQLAPKQQQSAQEKAADPADAFWQKGPDVYISEREQQLMQRFQSELAERDKRELLRERARFRGQHEDFESAEQAFVQAAKANPALFAKAEQSGDAFAYIYQHGKEIQRLREYGDVASFSDLEAKIRAKIETELKGGQPAAASQPTARTLPSKSIAGARGSSVGITKEWSGPRPAETFFTGPRI